MDALQWVFAALGLLGGFALGWMALSAKLSSARQQAAAAEKQLQSSASYAAGLKERADLTQERNQELSDALEQARGEAQLCRDRATALEERRHALDERLKEQQQELEKMREQLKLEFKTSANAIFEEMSQKFTVQSEKKIGDLLNPMQQHLNDFKKLVADSFTAQGKEQHTLKSEIEKIVLQTDSLAKALRGDVKAQGNWGEVMLERILEASGLEKGVGYTVQGAQMGLSGAEGNRLQPDVIVHLPDEKHLIIDAKVSLTAYERYCGEGDEAQRETHIKEFLRSVRAHINGLDSKAYPDIEKLGTPDFVLMFMPIEGAFSLALQKDGKLHAYAWEKRIVLVCPSTLFATLRTIASLWRIETYNRNAQEIARQGGALYDKFVGFIEDMQAIGRQMTAAQSSYDKAMNKLADGAGNLVGRAENLKKLGAKASKSLPKEMLGENAELLPLAAEG